MMSQKEKDLQPPPADFHGAAIIAENGKEVPITEDMVVNACEAMESTDTDAENE